MAAGQFSPQHLAFIQTVAQAAMRIDEHTREAPEGATKSQARAGRIARERALGRVLGLNGPADKYAAIRRTLEAAWVLHALGGCDAEEDPGDFRDLPPAVQDAVIARHRHLLPDPARFDGSDGRREVPSGEWRVGLMLRSSNGRSVRVAERYPFASDFNGETACKRAAEAFLPAVQGLISKLISNPEFPALLRPSP